MVKLIVKKAFRNSEDFTMFEENQEIEVSQERAQSIKDKLPGYTEEVKTKQKPRQTKQSTQKSKEKRKPNKDYESKE